MSRVVGFTQYGGPEVLEIMEVDIPAPKQNEIRISVKTIGLNRAESMWRTGVYVEPVNLPARLGYEVSGIVDAVGAGVTHVVVGDRVTTIPSFSQNDYGLYGELVVAPAHAVVKIPGSLGFEEATAIWNPFITPYGAFVEASHLSAGDTVLIPAASSAVGLGAIQVANMVGAITIALTRTSGKTDVLLEAGAAHVIATEEQDIVTEVLRITHGKGANFAFDPVGGATFPKLIKAMAPGGTLLVYGALSEDLTPLPMLEMVARQTTVRGYNLFGTTTDPVRQKAAVKFITDGLESGAIKPRIAARFAFDDIVEAHRLLEKNQHVGRIVVNV
jgi:NADPH:quinone reductase-like Zn-dependent oxidoreductase